MLKFVAFGSSAESLLEVARWPLLPAFITLALALLYYFAPDREHPRWRWVTAGSGAASVLWLVCSILFSWYAANFANYDKTYGSLGGIVALMAWLRLSCVVVLLGGRKSMLKWRSRPASGRPMNRSASVCRRGTTKSNSSR